MAGCAARVQEDDDTKR